MSNRRTTAYEMNRQDGDLAYRESAVAANSSVPVIRDLAALTLEMSDEPTKVYGGKRRDFKRRYNQFLKG